ncbi:hypothetical protein [Pontibacter roseus]|uniref:hypothetical protein n=1 Tax=Pontibacter roseus TaxID=336989 RepID=UPI00036386DB|nr:hypothetical protein [Pontibacter roseus]
MKKFALILIVLIICMLGYNLSQIDFSALTSVPNQRIYINLAGNLMILLSVVLTYMSYSRRVR